MALKRPAGCAKGFTLLELLVVVGILAALVALAMPYYQDYVNQSKITAAETDLKNFQKALAMYDQLEPTPFTGSDFRPLIGKYLQDYRTFAGQTMPRDPWGRDYQINVQEGTIICPGPNGQNETGNSRTAGGDDLVITWKPPFIVASARMISDTTMDIFFSRKIKTLTSAHLPASTSGGKTISGTPQKISDTQYRITLSGNAAGEKITLVSGPGQVEAQDGKATWDPRPEGGLGNEVTIAPN